MDWVMAPYVVVALMRRHARAKRRNVCGRTSDEDVALLPFDVSEDGADAVRRVVDDDDFVGVGADELGDALTELGKSFHADQAKKPVWVGLDLRGEVVACGSDGEGKRSVGTWVDTP